jgi:hypothetical protein
MRRTALLLCAAVVGTTLGVGCSSAGSGGSGSEGTLPVDQFEADITECEVDPGGDAVTRAAGTLTNHTGRRTAFELTIDFSNDRVRVDVATLLLQPLEDGASTEWEALGYDSLEEMEGVDSVECSVAGLKAISLTAES